MRGRTTMGLRGDCRVARVVKFETLALPGVRLLTPERHRDRRGFFSETYNRKALSGAGVQIDFLQDNHSLSSEPGTVRGLHFQAPPFAQDKLVRVVRGSIFDVAVDLRRSSPTYGRHVGVVISAETWSQILVPIGFAHGFATLEPGTEVIYKVSNYFAPAYEMGIAWNDRALGIQWPVQETTAIVSEKDRNLPRLCDSVSPFD